MDVERVRARCRGVALTERSASRSHFLDLFALFCVPGPVEADPTGEWFAFEKGATKATGGKGWADVWRRGFFAWEHKGHNADLAAAFRQIQRCRARVAVPRGRRCSDGPAATILLLSASHTGGFSTGFR